MQSHSRRRPSVSGRRRARWSTGALVALSLAGTGTVSAAVLPSAMEVAAGPDDATPPDAAPPGSPVDPGAEPVAPAPLPPVSTTPDAPAPPAPIPQATVTSGAGEPTTTSSGS